MYEVNIYNMSPFVSLYRHFSDVPIFSKQIFKGSNMFSYALTSAGSEVVLKPEPERGASADPEGGGGQGFGPPLENHKLCGFLQVIGNLTPPPPPGKSLTPPAPGKCSGPLRNLEK